MKDLLILSILLVFVWSGMVLGISFLEAPLKFQAPQMTLAIGLGVGRLVFAALNKIEIIFCLASLVILYFIKPPISVWILISVVSVLLAAQTFWLLPILDTRAGIIMAGGTPKGLSPHLYYIAGEIIKVIMLLSVGYNLISDINRNKKRIYS